GWGSAGLSAAVPRRRALAPARPRRGGRPRPGGEERAARLDRALRRVEAPARAVAVERARIARQRDPAERREALRIGAGERERIGNAGGALHVERMAKHRIERRLERARRVGIEHADRNAELRRDLALARGGAEAPVVAIELEPAGLAHETGGPPS